MARSTDFWSSARPEATFLACRDCISIWHVAMLLLSELSYLGLLALLEESVLTLGLRLLLSGEVGVATNLLDDRRVNAGDVNLGACCDNVAGVDASERDTVDLEGTGDEEDTLGEVLEENNALATEATSEEDQDGTGLEGSAGLARVLGLADLQKRDLSANCGPLCVYKNGRNAREERNGGRIFGVRAIVCFLIMSMLFLLILSGLCVSAWCGRKCCIPS